MNSITISPRQRRTIVPRRRTEDRAAVAPQQITPLLRRVRLHALAVCEPLMAALYWPCLKAKQTLDEQREIERTSFIRKEARP